VRRSRNPCWNRHEDRQARCVACPGAETPEAGAAWNRLEALRDVSAQAALTFFRTERGQDSCRIVADRLGMSLGAVPSPAAKSFRNAADARCVGDGNGPVEKERDEAIHRERPAWIPQRNVRSAGPCNRRLEVQQRRPLDACLVPGTFEPRIDRRTRQGNRCPGQPLVTQQPCAFRRRCGLSPVPLRWSGNIGPGPGGYQETFSARDGAGRALAVRHPPHPENRRASGPRRASRPRAGGLHHRQHHRRREQRRQRILLDARNLPVSQRRCERHHLFLGDFRLPHEPAGPGRLRAIAATRRLRRPLRRSHAPPRWPRPSPGCAAGDRPSRVARSSAASR
jgi:hypothetical protein